MIRGGRVLDGNGNPWILADVAIRDGRFVKIGHIEGRGKLEIDAHQRYVSPGWIDVMDQSGAVLRTNGLAENKLREGVTSAIAGEGGTPVDADKISDYFHELEVKGISLNFGSYFSETQGAAVGQHAGFFGWDPFGHLSTSVIAGIGALVPISVDPNFKTPYTSSAQIGVQHEFGTGFVVEANYYHKDISNILGIRNTNLAFEARIPGHTGELVPGTGSSIIQSYGPWFAGTYDAGMLSFRKRFSRLTVQANYTYTHATDDAPPNLVSENQTGSGLSFADVDNGPIDSFVGTPPVVTDLTTGKTNATGAFVASNGNPVPQAGKFYNGSAALGSGPSDLALTHTFLIHGIWTLPKGFSISSIFRAQTGFHYSAALVNSVDVDGDGLFNGLDFNQGRNHFTAPSYVNWDLRLAHQFKIEERATFHTYLEFFNLLNRANPAAVQSLPQQPQPFGSVLQVLPGRETQLGLRLEF